ncbi:hypothetical protein C8Q76DRAFT_635349 [Earliella scabrosa]|nr:hypothetical protein C8Q76DRAFT_635349 [Earliella scabrosa]
MAASLTHTIVKQAAIPLLWPNNLARIDTGRVDCQVTDSWRFVPDTINGLCDWADVVLDESEARRPGERHMLYMPCVLGKDALPNVEYQVMILLHGFVGRAYLGPLGNWSRKEPHAPAELQTLVLESAGCDEAFNAQKQALDNIREYIAMKSGGMLTDTSREATESITLQNQVFTKVRLTGTPPTAVKLNNDNDLRGRARAITSRWQVTHAIQTVAKRAGGKDITIAHNSIQRGDFIEVLVSVDIQTIRRHKASGTVIRFPVIQVAKLWSRQEAAVCTHAPARTPHSLAE